MLPEKLCKVPGIGLGRDDGLMGLRNSCVRVRDGFRASQVGALRTICRAEGWLGVLRSVFVGLGVAAPMGTVWISGFAVQGLRGALRVTITLVYPSCASYAEISSIQ